MRRERLAGASGLALEVDAEDAGDAAGAAREAEHGADGGGLSGAVGADEAEDLAAADREAQRGDAAASGEALRELVELDHVHELTAFRRAIALVNRSVNERHSGG
jgi:hypothetical protein